MEYTSRLGFSRHELGETWAPVAEINSLNGWCRNLPCIPHSTPVFVGPSSQGQGQDSVYRIWSRPLSKDAKSERKDYVQNTDKYSTTAKRNKSDQPTSLSPFLLFRPDPTPKPMPWPCSHPPPHAAMSPLSCPTRWCRSHARISLSPQPRWVRNGSVK